MLTMKSRGDQRAAVGSVWAGEVCSGHIDGLHPWAAGSLALLR